MDTAGEVLKLKTCEGNTGGHVVGKEGEHDVVTAAARGVIERACEKAKNGRVRLLKLDCEGAEWVILRKLGLMDFAYIDEIVGEAHPHTDEYGEPEDREVLFDRLRTFGYEIQTWKETSDGLIVFRAYRVGAPDLVVPEGESITGPVTVTDEGGGVVFDLPAGESVTGPLTICTKKTRSERNADMIDRFAEEMEKIDEAEREFATRKATGEVYAAIQTLDLPKVTDDESDKSFYDDMALVDFVRHIEFVATHSSQVHAARLIVYTAASGTAAEDLGVNLFVDLVLERG
jgi:hypothetical protein